MKENFEEMTKGIVEIPKWKLFVGHLFSAALGFGMCYLIAMYFWI